MVEEGLKAALRLRRQPQDDVPVALAWAAHGPKTIDDRFLEVDEALPSASIYTQHGPFRQNLGHGDEGGLGDGDPDHRPAPECPLAIRITASLTDFHGLRMAESRLASASVSESKYRPRLSRSGG